MMTIMTIMKIMTIEPMIMTNHETFVPTAEQAVEVLRWIAKNGRFPE